jgi:hypothetical protein
MELYLQFGYGMMELCKELIQKWGSGTVILSPRDLKPQQVVKFSTDILSKNGQTLLDPQLYDPRANHHGLLTHEYWPDDYSTSMLSGGAGLDRMLQCLKTLNDQAQTVKYIVPGLYCQRVNDDWLYVQENLIHQSKKFFNDKANLATICLSSEVLRFEDQIEMIINRAEQWDIDGFYIVPEHPNGNYLVEDPLWLTNILILCAGLKLLDKEVIVGYSNQQMLCLATTNIDSIASGTWMNVRSFPPDKFREDENESHIQRAMWYYCPQTLSEYKPAFLDMGYRAGILEQIRPDKSLKSNYADILFSGAQPSSTNYSEPLSFRHYLQCLHEQANQAHRKTFRETFDYHLLILETAERLISAFHRCGVRGQDRDFANIIDVNRAALGALEASRGFVLERQW